MKIKNLTLQEDMPVENVTVDLSFNDIKELANALHGVRGSHKKAYANFAMLFDLLKNGEVQETTIESLGGQNVQNS